MLHFVLFKYVMTEVPPTWLMGCVLQWAHWSQLEPAVSGMGQWPLFTKATLAAPL